MHELKIYRGVMCNDTKVWWKMWKGFDLLFQNWHVEFDEFWLKHSEAWKIYSLIGSFWPKYIMFELKKYRGVIFHGSEEWCKIWGKTDLWFEKWQEKFGKFSPEHLKVSKLGLWWDLFIQSRKCLSLFTEELCVVTMKNDTKFGEKLACCFKIDTTNLTNLDPRVVNLQFI